MRRSGDVLAFGGLLNDAEGRFAARLELLLDRLAPGAVFVALEGRRQGGAQLRDESFHRGRERGAVPRRQFEGAGLLRIVEIVDVAPVGRCRLALRPVAQQILDHGVPAGAARAEGIDVVPLGLDAQREVERLDGALLADQPGRLIELAAQLERQLGRVAAAIQQIRRQGLTERKARSGSLRRGCGLGPGDAGRWLIIHAQASFRSLAIFAQGPSSPEAGGGANALIPVEHIKSYGKGRRVA